MFALASTSWIAPRIPSIRANESISAIKEKFDRLLVDLHSSFLAWQCSVQAAQADREIGVRIYEAVRARDGVLQQWLYTELSTAAGSGNSLRLPRAVSESELKQAIERARDQFVPADSATFLLDEWKALRQGPADSLLVFGADWLNALQRLADDGHHFRETDIGMQLYVALNPASIEHCGKKPLFLAIRTVEDARDFIDNGIASERALRLLEAARISAHASGEHKAAARPNKSALKPASGSVNFVGDDYSDSEPEERPRAGGRGAPRFRERERRRKPGPCWCCGLAGDASGAHRWMNCPELEKLKGEAKAKGITDVMSILPHRPPPRRPSSGDGGSDSIPQRGSEEQGSSSAPAGDEDDERSSTDKSRDGGKTGRQVQFASRRGRGGRR